MHYRKQVMGDLVSDVWLYLVRWRGTHLTYHICHMAVRSIFGIPRYSNIKMPHSLGRVSVIIYAGGMVLTPTGMIVTDSRSSPLKQLKYPVLVLHVHDSTCNRILLEAYNDVCRMRNRSFWVLKVHDYVLSYASSVLLSYVCLGG